MAQAEICWELSLWDRSTVLGRLNLVLAPRNVECDWYEKETVPSVRLRPPTARLPVFHREVRRCAHFSLANEQAANVELA